MSVKIERAAWTIVETIQDEISNTLLQQNIVKLTPKQQQLLSIVLKAAVSTGYHKSQKGLHDAIKDEIQRSRLEPTLKKIGK